MGRTGQQPFMFVEIYITHAMLISIGENDCICIGGGAYAACSPKDKAKGPKNKASPTYKP